MSKQTRKLFEVVKEGEPPMGAIEAMKEGIQAVAPGLSLSKILGDIGQELKEQLAHGSHEMAAALFRGDAFVMYPRTNEGEQPQHVSPEAQQEQSVERDM